MINKNSILIYDCNCGICSLIAMKIRKYIADYWISPSIDSLDLMINFNNDPNISLHSVILIKFDYENNHIVFTEAFAVFEIVSD